MDWEGFGWVVAQTAISSGVVFAGVTWWIRLWFKSRAEQQLEQFKSQLQVHHFQLTLGKVRADEHQAKALNEVWAELVDLNDALEAYVWSSRECIESTSPETASNKIFNFQAAHGKLSYLHGAVRTNFMKASVNIEEQLAKDIQTAIDLFMSELVSFLESHGPLMDSMTAFDRNDPRYHDAKRKALAGLDVFGFDDMKRNMDYICHLMRKKLKVIEPTLSN